MKCNKAMNGILMMLKVRKAMSMVLYGIVANLMLLSRSICAMEVLVKEPADSEIVQRAIEKAKTRLYLGEMLMKGQGCAQDYAKAREHLKEAAQQIVDPEVQAWANIWLATLYHLGWGVEKDFQMVLEYEKAASQAGKDNKRQSEIEELLKILKDPSFDIKVMDKHGRTLLHLAVMEDRRELVWLLLVKGADIDGKINYAWTSNCAGQESHRKAVDLLFRNTCIMAGSKVGFSPLHLAASKGRKEIIKLLLDKGADLKALDMKGMTPLHRATERGHKETVELLLARKADVKMVDKYDHCTALHLAAERDDRKVVELLLENDADIDAADIEGGTPLNCAVKKGNRDVVELLLAKRAGSNVANNEDMTPLHWAASEGHQEIVEMLLDKRADIDPVDKYGLTPLNRAVKRGHKEVVDLLLDKGAGIAAVDKDGKKLIITQGKRTLKLLTLAKVKGLCDEKTKLAV